MDEDLAVNNPDTTIQKIKNFIFRNKKKIIIFNLIFLFILITFFGYNEYKEKKKIDISNLYNSVVINYSENNKDLTIKELINIIKKKDTTYSPLSLYFIIDNNLITNREKINELFDIILNETPLEKEIKNLIIYKKALYNADEIEENQILNILNPLINSNSIWKSHALYLMGEFFYFKNEKQKSKEFFEQIISLENANSNLKIAAQKRLNRDLSD